MVSFPFRAPSGIVGDVNRSASGLSIEPNMQDATLPAIAYGRLVKLSSTFGITPITTADALTAVYGITVRPYPTQQQSTTNYGAAAFGSSIPPTGQIDILKRGYINVRLYGSTSATKGGKVYVWTAVSGGTNVIGGFVAANPGGSGFEITNAYFTGPADPDGNAEIAYNL